MAWGLLEKQKLDKMLARERVPLLIMPVDLNSREQCCNDCVMLPGNMFHNLLMWHWDNNLLLCQINYIGSMSQCSACLHVCVCVGQLRRLLHSLVLIVNSPHLFSVYVRVGDEGMRWGLSGAGECSLLVKNKQKLNLPRRGKTTAGKAWQENARQGRNRIHSMVT